MTKITAMQQANKNLQNVNEKSGASRESRVSCAECDAPKTINLLYQYADGKTGVAGATYHVYDIRADGSQGGFSLTGVLDNEGKATVEIPNDIKNIEYYFSGDPDKEEIIIQPKKLESPEKEEDSWLKVMGDTIADGKDFIWGVIQGDL